MAVPVPQVRRRGFQGAVRMFPRPHNQEIAEPLQARLDAPGASELASSRLPRTPPSRSHPEGNHLPGGSEDSPTPCMEIPNTWAWC